MTSTKTAVIASALCAALIGLSQTPADQWILPLLAVAAAALAYAAGRKHPERTAAMVVGFGYVMPALLVLSTGSLLPALPLWIAPFAGALAATTTTGWHVPARLRFPLVLWALAIAFSWPLVFLRELDWMPSALWSAPASLHGPTQYVPVALAVPYSAATQMIGILWFDWLWSRFGRGAPGAARVSTDLFARRIIQPLLVSATLAAVVAVYQGFVDPRFLDVGVWAGIGRPGGAFADANVSGALSAMWAPAALLLVIQGRSLATTVLGASSAVLLLAGTWVTGSRTALLCAIVGLAAFAHLIVTSRASLKKVLAAVAVAGVGLWLAAGVLAPSVVGPVRRVTEVLPSLSWANVRHAAVTLWLREGYGQAAMAMIADEPLQGVGVGVYNILSSDYAAAVAGREIPADNAQNWFRHQFAELGILGSIGWIWWTGLLLAALVRRPRSPTAHGTAPSGGSASGLVARYTIVGFGAASLLGVPSQNAFITLTLWTLVFWLFLSDTAADVDEDVSSRLPPNLVGAVALALIFTGATAFAGWKDLRPADVAKRLDAFYDYGFYQPVGGPPGGTHTSVRGVSVPRAETSALKLTVWVEHPDADARPVNADVWVDGERIIHRGFPRNAPLSRVVPVQAGKRFILETRVDRTFALPSMKRPEVGLTLEWEFLDGP